MERINHERRDVPHTRRAYTISSIPPRNTKTAKIRRLNCGVCRLPSKKRPTFQCQMFRRDPTSPSPNLVISIHRLDRLLDTRHASLITSSLPALLHQSSVTMISDGRKSP